MLLYILRTNLGVLMVLLFGVSWAIAQDALPPPPLPETQAGTIDMIVKMTPFVFGMLAPYGNNLMKTMFPKIFCRVPVPLLMMISSILSMAASGLTAYVTSLGLQGAGGVSVDVAIVESGSTSLLAHQVGQKEPDQQSTPSAPKPPDEPSVGGITLHK